MIGSGMNGSDKHHLDCKEIILLIENQSRRMESLEHKFDALLVSIDSKMGKLVDVLISKQDFPIKMFGLILGAVLLAIFTAIFGHEVILLYITRAKV